LQGWSADPFGAHEVRYFSAGRPTKLVRDGRVESYDDPPLQDAWSSSVVVGEDGLSSAIPGTDRPRFLSGTQSDGPMPYVRGITPVPVTTKQRHGVAFAGTVAAAVGAIVLLIVTFGMSGSAPASGSVAPSLVAYVAASAQRTLTRQTAEVTLSGTVQSAGSTVPVHGDGAINFSANSMTFNFDASFSGHALAESEVLTGGNLYLRSTVNGQGINQLTGGRHWIRLPLVQSDPATLTSGDPLSALSILEAHGDSVTSLGTEDIDGESCTGYAVTPSEQAMVAAARQEFAKLGLSPAQVSAELQIVQRTPPATVTVWFDSHQLTRQISVAMQLSGVVGSGSVSAQMVVNFTHYGVPVHINAPAASDTLS